MSADIIKFPVPNKRANKMPETEREAMQKLAEYRMYIVDSILQTRFSQIARDVSSVGYPVDNKDFIKELVFSNELFKSVLYNHAGIFHPLHDEVKNLLEKYKNELTAFKDLDTMYHNLNEEDEYDEE